MPVPWRNSSMRKDRAALSAGIIISSKTNRSMRDKYKGLMMLNWKNCFRFCTASLSIISVCFVMQSCSANNGEGPITDKDNEAVKEGIKSADETPTVSLQPPPQTFTFEGHKFAIHASAPTKLQVLNRGNSRTFAFLGPERKNLGQNVFSILIVNGGASEKVPNKDELMKGMLHPFRQRLSDYKEEPFTLELANGRREAGTEFSGALGGAGNLRGFVVTIPVKDGIYSLTTTDRQEVYDESIKQLKTLAKSIKIEN